MVTDKLTDRMKKVIEKSKPFGLGKFTIEKWFDRWDEEYKTRYTCEKKIYFKCNDALKENTILEPQINCKFTIDTYGDGFYSTSNVRLPEKYNEDMKNHYNIYQSNWLWKNMPCKTLEDMKKEISYIHCIQQVRANYTCKYYKSE